MLRALKKYLNLLKLQWHTKVLKKHRRKVLLGWYELIILDSVAAPS